MGAIHAVQTSSTFTEAVRLAVEKKQCYILNMSIVQINTRSFWLLKVDIITHIQKYKNVFFTHSRVKKCLKSNEIKKTCHLIPVTY